MDRSALVTGLRGIPGQLAALLDGLPDAQIRRRPSEAEWSLVELACHLRDAAEEEFARVTLMPGEDNPTLPPYDADQRALDRHYIEDDPASVLADVRSRFDGTPLAWKGSPLTSGGAAPFTQPSAPQR